jgi:hypothetical protein
MGLGAEMCAAEFFEDFFQHGVSPGYQPFVMAAAGTVT